MSREKEIVALTLWAEARNEPEVGKIAVLWVIKNRAEMAPKRFGATLEEVCLKKWQFSCWNESDPQRKFLDGFLDRSREKTDSVKECEDLLERFLKGEFEDPTKGASHYYNPKVASPKWGAGPGGLMIGSHRFLRPEELLPPERAKRSQSKTIQATTIGAAASCAGAVVTATGGLSSMAQVTLILSFAVFLFLFIYIFKERLKSWAAGWR